MAECDFSWFKMFSFFGAAVLVMLAFILVASGIYWITDGQVPYGVASILGAVLSGVVAYQVYINYQKKS